MPMQTYTKYRFLIQLVDAKTEAEALQTIAEMYGQRTADVVRLAPWTERRKSGKWVDTEDGITVFVPIGFKV